MESDTIHIVLKDITLSGKIHSPDRPRGLVIVATKEDCELLRIENEYLFKALCKKNIASLFTYLLDPPESQDLDIPFDIGVMREHIEQLTNWISHQPSMKDLPLGYFAVNTAAASILEASIPAGRKLRAIV